MPATTLSRYLRERPADTMGALGLVSGILSAGWGQTYELKPLQPLAMMFFLDSGALLIGFFYGVAMGIGISAWVRKPWAVPVVLVTTMYAWSAAIHTAIRLQRTGDDDPHLVAASVLAGALGAGLTQLGCSLFAPDLRRPPWRIVLTCAVGAVAGILFYMGHRKIIDERLLFFVWQPAVAFCIGLGLPKQSARQGA